MPVLDPALIATWWHFEDRDTGNARLFESWTETQHQDVNPKPLLQGDVGTHVMDVGGVYWETSINSPVIIVEYVAAPGVSGIDNIFDIIVNEFNIIQDPTLLANANRVMTSATIDINEQAINCAVGFLSDAPNIFEPIFGLANAEDYIARVAKGFLDAMFYVQDAGINSTYQIKSGNIKINVDVNKTWLIGRGVYPFYSVNGYRVQGEMTLLANPVEFKYENQGTGLIITPQETGTLDTTTSVANTAIRIGNLGNSQLFNFGEAALTSEIMRSMKAGEIATIKVAFKTYVRFTTNIS